MKPFRWILAGAVIGIAVVLAYHYVAGIECWQRGKEAGALFVHCIIGTIAGAFSALAMLGMKEITEDLSE